MITPVARRVFGIIVPRHIAYACQVALGVRDYVAAGGNWDLCWIDPPPPELVHDTNHRIMGRLAAAVGFYFERAIEERHAKAGIPIVNVSSREEHSIFPRVHMDNVAVGRMAAEHFLNRGFQKFAFVGHLNFFYGEQRREGFLAALKSAGYDLITSPLDEMDWLKTLSEPVAVLGSGDVAASQIVRHALHAGFRVPEDVAVLGVDNDVLACELADVPLSSVDTNGRRVGYIAAELLDRMVNGEKPPTEPILVPPKGIVTRRSSEVVACADPVLASALTYIREHACERIDVTDVVAGLPVGRRTLERRFRAAFGRTLHDEIRRTQLERALPLLRDTDLLIPTVSERCGFGDSKLFSRLFHQRYGCTPSSYRHSNRVR